MTSGKQLFIFDMAISNIKLYRSNYLMILQVFRVILIKSWPRSSIFLSLFIWMIFLSIPMILVRVMLKPLYGGLMFWRGIGYLPIWRSVNFIKIKFVFWVMLYRPRELRWKINKSRWLKISLNQNQYKRFKFLLVLPISINISFKASAGSLHYSLQY